MTGDVLILPRDLAAELSGPTPPVVLDVRWKLGADADGRADYLESHIPGAVFVDLDRELAGHGAPEDGRHPLPEIDDLQASARSWGVRSDSRVVVYDDLGNMSSARAWWLLRWAGVADVRLLDGALAGWRADGLPVDDAVPDPAPGDVVLTPGHLPTLDVEEAGAFPATGVLIDSRAAERYRGEMEPMDPKAGHIPGAVNVPTAANVDSDGRFLPVEDLRERFAAAGVDGTHPVGVYCGSGVTAAHNAVALTLLGFEPALYPGSWSAWSNRDLPVATGPSEVGRADAGHADAGSAGPTV